MTSIYDHFVFVCGQFLEKFCLVVMCVFVIDLKAFVPIVAGRKFSCLWHKSQFPVARERAERLKLCCPYQIEANITQYTIMISHNRSRIKKFTVLPVTALVTSGSSVILVSLIFPRKFSGGNQVIKVKINICQVITIKMSSMHHLRYPT